MDKRMKRIGAGLIVFMVFMWLCTLISKSIYASKLPLVSTCGIDARYIEHVVEAEGIVEAGSKLPVTVLGGLRVVEVFVQTGDRVEEGALLFTVDREDMKEIMAEQELASRKIRLQIDTILHNRELAEEKKALEEARAREDYDALARYQDTLVGRAAENVVQAEEALDELQAENREHEDDWEKEDGERKTEEEIEAERKAREEEEERLKQEVQAAAYAEADARWNRDNIMKDAGRKVEDTVSEEDEDATLAVYYAEVESIQEKLAAYQEILDGEGKIAAPMGGMVTDVYVQAGGRVPDTASFLMADDEVPCQFRVPLTKEDKTYVNLGDDVKLKLGDRKEINAAIDYLTENENAPGSFTAVLRLPEETGTPGQSGTIICAKSGEKRPCCIPLLALHEEQNKSYVYVVGEREGILGMEYYVEEINVTVVDKNDKFAAIEGAVTEESRIIQSADREMKRGDVIRLANP